MLNIIIAAYGEPKSTELAINSILKQGIKQKFRLIVSDPFPETEELIYNKYNKVKEVEYFEDPGMGKSFALNILFEKLYNEDKNDIIIVTDGDVFLADNSISEILKLFKDPKIGCATGRPLSLNSRKSLFGYWSHFLMDVGAHKISREKRFSRGEFLECSGYFFAFRNGVIKNIPVEVAEDTIVPYYFWKKGYKIGYGEKAGVYVKWPDNLKEWMMQKKRTADSHTKLDKYAPDRPKVKSFFREVLEGTFLHFSDVWSYPKNSREMLYTIILFPTRLFMWISLKYDLSFKKKEYIDGWRAMEVKESTKILD